LTHNPELLNYEVAPAYSKFTAYLANSALLYRCISV